MLQASKIYIKKLIEKAAKCYELFSVEFLICNPQGFIWTYCGVLCL